MTPLGLTEQGELAVPPSADALGWWADGPVPGEPGAAVVVGHVDLDGEPGVFSRLAQLPLGSELVVRTSSGSVARFRVVSSESYPKQRFPTAEVYRPAAEPELRLITCGGRFDKRSGHYESNVVVRAVRVVSPAPR